jgi:hypothetical protein
MKKFLPKFFALVLFSLTAVAAADNFNIKPGLWETTTSSQSQGTPAIPPEQQAQMEKMRASMSPEMRAKIEAAQKKANSGAPHVQKSCVTKEDLNKPLAFDSGRADGNCTKTVLKSTSNAQEVRIDCSSDRYKSTGIARFTAPNPETFNGTIESTLTPVGKGAPITVKTSASGKWLGSDCGDVKPHSQSDTVKQIQKKK